MHLVRPMVESSPVAAGCGPTECATNRASPQKERQRALVIPREHGAWGILLVPLASGAAIGLLSSGHVRPVLLLTTAVLSLFWLRTPVESWLGTSVLGVQTRKERRLVWIVILPLVTTVAVTLTALFWQGNNRQLIWPGMIAGFAIAAQTFLKKMGRTKRMAAEMVGALALTSTAPAAYCVATGQLDARAWALWLVNWLFAADQIHFVWLRIRGARAAELSEKVAVGRGFLAGNIMLGGVLTLACRFRYLPYLTLVAFAPILLRGFVWFAKAPQPIVVRRLGWTELAHALVFGLLLTAAFGFAR